MTYVERERVDWTDVDLMRVAETASVGLPLDVVEIDELELELAEALTAAELEVWEEKHPRWPAGTPKAGQFMRVGETFKWQGKTYEVAYVLDGKIYANEASGKVKAKETREFPANKAGVVPDVEKAEPRQIKGGAKHENVPVIDPYTHPETHDPSIAKPEGSQISDAEWLKFGKLDQEFYVDLQRTFGDWGTSKAQSFLNESWDAASAEIRAAVKKAYSDQYNDGYAEMSGNPDAGHKGGWTFNAALWFHKVFKKTQSLEKAEEKRAQMKQLLYQHRRVIAWDLYNRIGAATIATFHKDSNSNHGPDWWNKEIIEGDTPMYSGVSQTWRYSQNFGSTGVLSPFAIRNVVMSTSVAHAYHGYESEYEVAFADRLALDPHKSVVIADSKLQGVYKWLQTQTAAKPRDGTIIEMVQDYLQGGGSLPIPPEPAHLQMSGASAKKYLDPPAAAMDDVFAKSQGYQEVNEDGTPVAKHPKDWTFGPGDYMEGTSDNPEVYLILDAPGQESESAPGIVYMQLTGSNKGQVYAFGASSPKRKLAAHFDIPPPPKVKGAVLLTPGQWSSTKDSYFLSTFQPGEKFLLNGHHLVVTGQNGTGSMKVWDYDAQNSGTINGTYKSPKLVPNNPDAPDSELYQYADGSPADGAPPTGLDAPHAVKEPQTEVPAYVPEPSYTPPQPSYSSSYEPPPPKPKPFPPPEYAGNVTSQPVGTPPSLSQAELVALTDDPDLSTSYKPLLKEDGTPVTFQVTSYSQQKGDADIVAGQVYRWNDSWKKHYVVGRAIKPLAGGKWQFQELGPEGKVDKPFGRKPTSLKYGVQVLTTEKDQPTPPGIEPFNMDDWKAGAYVKSESYNAKSKPPLGSFVLAKTPGYYGSQKWQVVRVDEVPEETYSPAKGTVVWTNAQFDVPIGAKVTVGNYYQPYFTLEPSKPIVVGDQVTPTDLHVGDTFVAKAEGKKLGATMVVLDKPAPDQVKITPVANEGAVVTISTADLENVTWTLGPPGVPERKVDGVATMGNVKIGDEVKIAGGSALEVLTIGENGVGGKFLDGYSKGEPGQINLATFQKGVTFTALAEPGKANLLGFKAGDKVGTGQLGKGDVVVTSDGKELKAIRIRKPAKKNAAVPVDFEDVNTGAVLMKQMYQDESMTLLHVAEPPGPHEVGSVVSLDNVAVGDVITLDSETLKNPAYLVTGIEGDKAHVIDVGTGKPDAVDKTALDTGKWTFKTIGGTPSEDAPSNVKTPVTAFPTGDKGVPVPEAAVWNVPQIVSGMGMGEWPTMGYPAANLAPGHLVQEGQALYQIKEMNGGFAVGASVPTGSFKKNFSTVSGATVKLVVPPKEPGMPVADFSQLQTPGDKIVKDNGVSIEVLPSGKWLLGFEGGAPGHETDPIPSGKGNANQYQWVKVGGAPEPAPVPVSMTPTFTKMDVNALGVGDQVQFGKPKKAWVIAKVEPQKYVGDEVNEVTPKLPSWTLEPVGGGNTKKLDLKYGTIMGWKKPADAPAAGPVKVNEQNIGQVAVGSILGGTEAPKWSVVAVNGDLYTVHPLPGEAGAKGGSITVSADDLTTDYGPSGANWNLWPSAAPAAPAEQGLLKPGDDVYGKTLQSGDVVTLKGGSGGAITVISGPTVSPYADQGPVYIANVGGSIVTNQALTSMPGPSGGVMFVSGPSGGTAATTPGIKLTQENIAEYEPQMVVGAKVAVPPSSLGGALSYTVAGVTGSGIGKTLLLKSDDPEKMPINRYPEELTGWVLTPAPAVPAQEPDFPPPMGWKVGDVLQTGSEQYEVVKVDVQSTTQVNVDLKPLPPYDPVSGDEVLTGVQAPWGPVTGGQTAWKRISKGGAPAPGGVVLTQQELADRWPLPFGARISPPPNPDLGWTPGTYRVGHTTNQYTSIESEIPGSAPAPMHQSDLVGWTLLEPSAPAGGKQPGDVVGIDDIGVGDLVQYQDGTQWTVGEKTPTGLARYIYDKDNNESSVPFTSDSWTLVSKAAPTGKQPGDVVHDADVEVGDVVRYSNGEAWTIATKKKIGTTDTYDFSFVGVTAHATMQSDEWTLVSKKADVPVKPPPSWVTQPTGEGPVTAANVDQIVVGTKLNSGAPVSWTVTSVEGHEISMVKDSDGSAGLLSKKNVVEDGVWTMTPPLPSGPTAGLGSLDAYSYVIGGTGYVKEWREGTIAQLDSGSLVGNSVVQIVGQGGVDTDETYVRRLDTGEIVVVNGDQHGSRLELKLGSTELLPPVVEGATPFPIGWDDNISPDAIWTSGSGYNYDFQGASGGQATFESGYLGESVTIDGTDDAAQFIHDPTWFTEGVTTSLAALSPGERFTDDGEPFVVVQRDLAANVYVRSVESGKMDVLPPSTAVVRLKPTTNYPGFEGSDESPHAPAPGSVKGTGFDASALEFNGDTIAAEELTYGHFIATPKYGAVKIVKALNMTGEFEVQKRNGETTIVSLGTGQTQWPKYEMKPTTTIIPDEATGGDYVGTFDPGEWVSHDDPIIDWDDLEVGDHFAVLDAGAPLSQAIWYGTVTSKYDDVVTKTLWSKDSDWAEVGGTTSWVKGGGTGSSEVVKVTTSWSEDADPNDDPGMLTPGAMTNGAALGLGARFEAPGLGAPMWQAVAVYDDRVVARPLSVGPDGKVVGWMGGPEGKLTFDSASSVKYVGQADLVDMPTVPDDPNELPYAEANGLVPYGVAWSKMIKGVQQKTQKISSLAQGTVFASKNHKLWKVEQAGNNPVVSNAAGEKFTAEPDSIVKATSVTQQAIADFLAGQPKQPPGGLPELQGPLSTQADYFEHPATNDLAYLTALDEGDFYVTEIGDRFLVTEKTPSGFTVQHHSAPAEGDDETYAGTYGEPIFVDMAGAATAKVQFVGSMQPPIEPETPGFELPSITPTPITKPTRAGELKAGDQIKVVPSSILWTVKADQSQAASPSHVVVESPSGIVHQLPKDRTVYPPSSVISVNQVGVGQVVKGQGGELIWVSASPASDTAYEGFNLSDGHFNKLTTSGTLLKMDGLALKGAEERELGQWPPGSVVYVEDQAYGVIQHGKNGVLMQGAGQGTDWFEATIVPKFGLKPPDKDFLPPPESLFPTPEPDVPADLYKPPEGKVYKAGVFWSSLELTHLDSIIVRSVEIRQTATGKLRVESYTGAGSPDTIYSGDNIAAARKAVVEKLTDNIAAGWAAPNEHYLPPSVVGLDAKWRDYNSFFPPKDVEQVPAPSASAPPVGAPPPESYNIGQPKGIPNYGGVQLSGGKSAGGTTGAKKYDGPGGPWLLKTYNGDEDRVATELLANAIYRQMDIPVANAGVTEVGGKQALTYPLLEGEPKQITTPSKELGKGYMTDALVANWDVIGLEDDNVLWTAAGAPIRVDQGGTLQYRAQGAKKNFGSVPTEVWTMLEPKGQPSGKMVVTPAMKRDQAGQIATVLDDGTIDGLVDQAPFQDETMREEVRQALKDRVAWMEEYAQTGKGIPGEEPEAPPQKKNTEDGQELVMPGWAFTGDYPTSSMQVGELVVVADGLVGRVEKTGTDGSVYAVIIDSPDGGSIGDGHWMNGMLKMVNPATSDKAQLVLDHVKGKLDKNLGGPPPSGPLATALEKFGPEAEWTFDPGFPGFASTWSAGGHFKNLYLSDLEPGTKFRIKGESKARFTFVGMGDPAAGGFTDDQGFSMGVALIVSYDDGVAYRVPNVRVRAVQE